MEKESTKITLWKQIVNSLIYRVKKTCHLRQKNKDLNRYINLNKVQVDPKCLFFISKPICNCQKKCLKDIKKIIEPVFLDCTYYRPNNVFLDEDVDCKLLINYLTKLHLSKNLEFEHYKIYKNEMVSTKSYKYVIEDFCDKNLDILELTCYLHSFKIFCTIESDCFKFTKYLLEIDCSPSRYAQIINLIIDNFQKSMINEHEKYLSTVSYLDKIILDLSEKDTYRYELYNNFFIHLFKNMDFYNEKEHDDIKIITFILEKNFNYATKSTESFIKLFKDISESLNSTDIKNQNFFISGSSRIIKNNILRKLNVPSNNHLNISHETQFVKFPDIKFQNIPANTISGPINNKTYVEIKNNMINELGVVISLKISGCFLLSSIIFSFILYKFKIKNSILGTIMLTLFLINFVAFGILLFKR